MSSSQSSTHRKWLREASMKRLSQLVKNKTETIDSANKLKLSLASSANLEDSGLSCYESAQLMKWVEGQTSGRQCMLALLDHRFRHRVPVLPLIGSSEAFDVLSVLRYMYALPPIFTCNSGPLFEDIFSKPPNLVIKESVQALVTKAEEASSSQLGIEQVNLALKQLKLDALCAAHAPDEDDSEDELDADSASTSSKTNRPFLAASKSQTSEERQLSTCIRIELIRIHIRRTLLATQDVPLVSFEADDDLNSPDLLPFFVMQSAGIAANSLEDLEAHNARVRPYLRYISAVKAQTSSYLDNLMQNKSFLVLGLPGDCEEMEKVKKQYRVLAVRMHPDKPGGSKEAFQMLQTAYQEVVRKVQEREVEARVLQKMAQDDLKMYHDIMKKKGKKPRRESRPPEEATATPAANTVPTGQRDAAASVQAQTQAPTAAPVEADVENITPTNAPPPPPSEVSADRIKPPPPPPAPESYFVDDADSDAEPEVKLFTEEQRLRSAPARSEDLIPPFLPRHSHDIQHAEEIQTYISGLLEHVHKHAKKCTHALQRSIKISKVVKKAAQQKKTANAKGLKHIQQEMAHLLKPVDAQKGEKPVLGIIGDVERVCDLVQRLCATVLSLPQDCGVHVSQAVYTHGSTQATSSLVPQRGAHLIEEVERAMSLSLSALKTVVPLVTAGDQLGKCATRLRDHLEHCPPASTLQYCDSLFLDTHADMQALLVDMCDTGVRNVVQAMQNSVDRVLDLVYICNNVHSQVDAILVHARESYLVHVRRQAQEVQVAGEDELCAEDQDALRQARAGSQGQSTGDGEPRAGEPPNESAKKPSSAGDVMEDLKDKIKALQVQLLQQQLQALQSANNDLFSMQTRIVQEVRTLPLVRGELGEFVDRTYTPAVRDGVHSLLAEALDYDLAQLRAALHDLLGFCGGERSGDLCGRADALVTMQFDWLRGHGSGGGGGWLGSVRTPLLQVIRRVAVAHGGRDSTTEPRPSPRLSVPMDYRGKLLALAGLLAPHNSHDGLHGLAQELKTKVQEVVEEMEDKYLAQRNHHLE